MSWRTLIELNHDLTTADPEQLGRLLAQAAWATPSDVGGRLKEEYAPLWGKARAALEGTS